MPRRRQFQRGYDDATMPMPHLRDKFINLYRKVHGSNVGLSDAEIMRMDRATLRRNIRSLQMAYELIPERLRY